MPPAAVTPGIVSNLSGEILLEGRPAHLVVADCRQVHFEGEDTLDANAQVYLLQPVETGQQDGGSREQRQRERHLGGSQRAAEPGQPPGTRRRTRLLAQRFDGRGPGQTQSRRDSEKHATHARCQQSKEQHLGVETHVVQAWQRLAPEGLQHSNANASQHESEHAAKERQHETLDQELARKPGPAGPERGAYRELVHAAGRSNEGEVGHVHAGHEQDEPYGGEDQVQRASRLCDELLVQRRRDDGALLCGRPAFPHRPRQRSELGLGLLQGDATSQPADRGQRVVLFVGVLRKAIRGPHGHVRRNRVLEVGSSDPCHFSRSTTHSNRRADDAGIAAEVGSPGCVAEHDPLRARLIVAIEAAAKLELRAEHIEVAARHEQGAEAFSAAVDEEIHPPLLIVRDRRDILERRGVGTEKREMRASENASRVGLVRVQLVEANQLSGLCVRQRGEEHGLNDAEHGRRTTNAQAERGHHHGGKTGAGAELPERVAKILGALLDPADAVHVVDVLTHERGIAELTAGGEVGIIGRHALASIALGEQIQVRVHLQPGVGVQAPASQHEQEPRDTRAEPSPHVRAAPLHGGGRSDPPAGSRFPPRAPTGGGRTQ